MCARENWVEDFYVSQGFSESENPDDCDDSDIIVFDDDEDDDRRDDWGDDWDDDNDYFDDFYDGEDGDEW